MLVLVFLFCSKTLRRVGDNFLGIRRFVDAVMEPDAGCAVTIGLALGCLLLVKAMDLLLLGGRIASSFSLSAGVLVPACCCMVLRMCAGKSELRTRGCCLRTNDDDTLGTEIFWLLRSDVAVVVESTNLSSSSCWRCCCCCCFACSSRLRISDGKREFRTLGLGFVAVLTLARHRSAVLGTATAWSGCRCELAARVTFGG